MRITKYFVISIIFIALLLPTILLIIDSANSQLARHSRALSNEALPSIDITKFEELALSDDNYAQFATTCERSNYYFERLCSHRNIRHITPKKRIDILEQYQDFISYVVTVIELRDLLSKQSMSQFDKDADILTNLYHQLSFIVTETPQLLTQMAELSNSIISMETLSENEETSLLNRILFFLDKDEIISYLIHSRSFSVACYEALIISAPE